MRRRTCSAWLIAAVFLAISLPSRAEPPVPAALGDATAVKDAQDIFTSLYKPKIDAATTPGDKITLAKDLLEASKLPEVQSNLYLAEKLLRSTIDLAGRFSAGRDLAAEAREALAPIQEQQAAAAKAAKEKEAIEKELAKDMAALEKNPRDKAVREKLLRLQLADLNDAPAAEKLLEESLDQKWQTYVPLAGKNVDDLPEASCMDMGVWYRDLVDGAMTTKGKANVLSRAKACLERFLALHTAQDAARLKAKVFLDQTDKDLAKLAAGAQGVPRSKSILSDMSGMGTTKTRDGLVIRGELRTKASVSPPIRITYVVKTDSTNIRIGYAAGQIIFNWEMNPDELRIDGGPAAGQYKKGAGRVPTNKFVTIVQDVGPRAMSVSVDGARRATWTADFSRVNEPIRIFPMGSTLTIQDIRIERPGN